jgi:hypothetical protein
MGVVFSVRAAEDPLNVRQNGPAKHMSESERRAFDRTPTMARADNVLFAMPDGWRRRDKDSGVSIIYPTDCPQGQWVELRFVPPEPKNGSVRDHAARGVEQIKKMFTSCRDLAPATVSRLEYGGEAIMQLVAATDSGQNTILFALCYCAADDLVQPLIIATNSGQLYQRLP